MAVIPRIGFLLHSLELLNHFGPVMDLLPADSFDLVIHPPASEAEVKPLMRWPCGVRSSESVLSAGDQYAWLVSNHPITLEPPPLIKRLAQRNARFMYAAGKSRWNLSDWNALYDLILCYGPFHAEAFSHISNARIVQMGYPRFDRFFTETPDRDALCKRHGCDPARETVVWLPTWKELTSVGLFNREISALTERYNVVVKLHPLLPHTELDKVMALARYRFHHFITDSRDNLPLYQLADYILADYGGSPMAALYTDRRLLLLNVPNAEHDTLTGADSPDIVIRQHIVNVNRGEDRIAASLADAGIWAAQAPVRKALREQYFAPHFGNSSQVAAETLLQALRG